MRDLLLLVLLCLMVGVADSRLRVADACSKYANGCSIPCKLPFFYKRQFTKACNRHDVCYGCGAYKGISRKECDKAFLRDMTSTCRTRWFRSTTPHMRQKRSLCRRFAELYYGAVRAAASSHYSSSIKKDSYCSASWVPSCLP